MAQPGRALGSGPRGRRFKSFRPDQHLLKSARFSGRFSCTAVSHVPRSTSPSIANLRHSRWIVGIAPKAARARSRAVVMRPALIGVLLADPALIAETGLCRFRPIRRATPGALSNPTVSNQGVTPFDRSRESFVGRQFRLRIVLRWRRRAHWQVSRRHRRGDPYQRLAVGVHRTTAEGAPTAVGMTHTCLLGASDCHAIAKAGEGDSRMFHIEAIGSTG